jgi:hypothetical protein
MEGSKVRTERSKSLWEFNRLPARPRTSETHLMKTDG